MVDRERNLVIVHSPGRQSISDFITIRALIADRAPEIEVFIVANGARQSVTRRQASRRPTLVFSPVEIRDFRPARGKIYAGKLHSKIEEIRRLAEAGLRVPAAVLVEPDTRLDPDFWGPFVVLKPNFGSQGRGVRVCRTQDVHWVDPKSWPPNDPRHGRATIAQKFIDTGPFSESRRVMTIFGRPVYSLVSRATEPRPLLDPLASGAIEHPIASNAGARVLELNFEADVIDYAKTVHRAFLEIPVHGVDMIRERKTGLLYVLEINSAGGTWHISSNHGLSQMRQYGIDMKAQFGALDIVADALIEITRREAE